MIHKSGVLRQARPALFSALVFAMCVGAFAQTPIDSLTPTRLGEAGFHINQISMFSSYSNFRDNLAVTGSSPFDFSAHGYGAGIATGVGWSKTPTDLSTFSVSYAVNYNYQYQGSNLFNTGYLTQSLEAGWTRKLGTKFTFAFTLAGSMGSFDQLILIPTSAQSLSALPGTAQDLAGAVALGQSSNPDLSAAANGASALVAPQQQLLYGGRILTV